MDTKKQLDKVMQSNFGTLFLAFCSSGLIITVFYLLHLCNKG